METKIKRFNELGLMELYEILRCRSEVFVVEQGFPYQDLDYADIDSTHIFMEEGGKILAYLRVIDPGVRGEAASIGRVLTMKEARGRGLARQMMKEAIRIAKAKSPVIEIHAQSYLKDFYQSLGFEPTSEEYILEGRPHVSMKMK